MNLYAITLSLIVLTLLTFSLTPSTVSARPGRSIIATFVILLSPLAGIASVPSTDLAIGLSPPSAPCTALPVLAHNFGGWSAVRAAPPASHFQPLGDMSFIQAME